MWLLVSLLCSIGLTLIIYFYYVGRTKNSLNHDEPATLIAFRRKYLSVYVLANASDWLQGPYVYALYESYGFGKDSIASLFITGFFSSLLFGTFFGSLADMYGRKKMTMAFGVVYMASCLTKLSSSFTILIIGRLLAGISTSLLFSVFESWMIHEHHKQGFDQLSLNKTFSLSVTLNGVSAIISGVIASVFASLFGFVAPFILSFVVLLIMMVMVQSTWNENVGSASKSGTDFSQTFENLKRGFYAINDDKKILLLGLVQSLFEGSMYIFVFMWTPTLAQSEPEFRRQHTYVHGIVFSSFMVAMMLGSSIFSYLTTFYTSNYIMFLLLSTATVALSLPVVTNNATVLLIGFFLFELCCGVYFPTMGSLRSVYLPDDTRASVMSILRVGLNLLVVFVLKVIGSISLQATFLICVSWLIIANVVNWILTKPEKSSPTDTLDVL